MNKEGVYFVLMLGFLSFAGGSFIGNRVGTWSERSKAIEAGVGAWTIDAKTGQSEFVYGARQP